MSFDTKDKLDEVLRELETRKNVYPALVKNGSISEAIAKRRIAILTEIAEDLQQKRAREMLG